MPGVAYCVVCQCCSPLGKCFWADLGLGMLDVSRVRFLGLPAIGMDAIGMDQLGSDSEPKGSESKAVAAEDGPESEVVQKFQLGETLPVVSARIVRCILKGNFVDMEELSEEHLEFELRRSAKGDDTKPLPPHKLRPAPDILTWARSFCHFAGIVVQAHPDKAVDLWAYLAFMLFGGERGDWWRAYDARFRQQMPSLEKARFGHLDQALYTKTVLWAGTGGIQRPGMCFGAMSISACMFPIWG